MPIRRLRHVPEEQQLTTCLESCKHAQKCSVAATHLLKAWCKALDKQMHAPKHASASSKRGLSEPIK